MLLKSTEYIILLNHVFKGLMAFQGNIYAKKVFKL